MSSTDVMTSASVQAFFTREAQAGRTLWPEPDTASGLGRYVKYEQAVKLLADPNVTAALDLGCNRGGVEALFHKLHPSKARATRITGIDITEQAIRNACDMHLDNCWFSSYDGVHVPFPDHFVDLTLMVEVIEHVPDKESLLREAWRVLKPGGRLFLTTPNPQCLALRVESFMWRVLRRMFHRAPEHKDSYIGHRSLVNVMDRIGFRQARSGTVYFWPHAYLYFCGWSLLPPLPPSWLLHWVQWWARWWPSRSRPEWLDRRICWTLAGVWVKPISK